MYRRKSKLERFIARLASETGLSSEKYLYLKTFQSLAIEKHLGTETYHRLILQLENERLQTKADHGALIQLATEHEDRELRRLFTMPHPSTDPKEAKIWQEKLNRFLAASNTNNGAELG